MKEEKQTDSVKEAKMPKMYLIPDQVVKIIPIKQSMDYKEIAKVISCNIEDYMLDMIAPEPRELFNAVSVKRCKNQLIISYCRYDEFN